MPPSSGVDCGSTQPPCGTARAGERGNVGARKSKVPEENQACVSEAAAAAVAASSSDQEEGSVPNWRPEEEFDLEVALEVINFRNELPGAGSDGLHFAHLQSIIGTGFGSEKFEAGIEAFWRRIIDDPNAFQPQFWQLLLQSNLAILGEKCPPVRGDDVEAAYCGRNNAAVATTAGGGQPRSETVWSRSTRGGGTGSATRKST